jgi:mycofactocin glycosyltransferase
VTVLPEGFGIDLDRSVRTFHRGCVLVGGVPGRVFTLSAAGADVVADLIAGKAASTPARRLGGRLVDAGLAHPRWDADPGRPELDRPVTIVVPARDRSEDLDRCLTSLDGSGLVLVVDDGSTRPDLVASVCARHGASLVVRAANGGPGAARNDGLATAGTEYVAFVDSDCVVGPGWLAPLLRHFDDPTIGAVAPRVRPMATGRAGPDSALDRYSASRSALDMGPRPSEVGPDRRVRYVPTAALVVRRAAVAEGFDPGLRVGEDVDLVWRLLDRWRVRFEPSVTVHHGEPSSWWALLARRHRYGTAAGPLARRHRGRLAPVELRPWPTGVVAALALRRPGAAAAVLVVSTARLAASVRGKGIATRRSLLWNLEGVGWTWVGIGRAATMLASPLVVLAALHTRRAAVFAALLVLTPPTVEWWQRRPGLDPFRWAAASIADDLAYGSGVWAGCVSARSVGPLVPALRRIRTSPSSRPTSHRPSARTTPPATPDGPRLV